LYIVTETHDGETAAFGANSGGTAEGGGPGFLERVLAPLLDGQ
jgi:hypothetical protein